MADFSLTTLFVVPVGQTDLPSSGSTQDLTPGQLGFFDPEAIDPKFKNYFNSQPNLYL